MQFKNKEPSALEIHKDITAITGATISSKAILDALKESKSP